MLASALFVIAALPAQVQPIVCPVGGEAADLEGSYMDYNGARYWFCCPGCDVQFSKEPTKFVEARAKDGKTAGDFLFDPVSGNRLKAPAIIPETSDYKGIRFHFSSKKNKEAFDKDPAKYGAMPKKEALYCAVASEVIDAYGDAASFVDFQGVRYYTCCPGCVAKMREDPAKYAPNAKDHITAPKIATEKE